MLRELSLDTLESVTGGSADGIRGRAWQRLLAMIALRLPQLRCHAYVLKSLQLQVCATAALAGSRLHVRLEHGPHLQDGKVGSDRIKGGGVRRGAVRCGAARCWTAARTLRLWTHQQNSAKLHTPRQSSVAPQPAST